MTIIRDETYKGRHIVYGVSSPAPEMTVSDIQQRFMTMPLLYWCTPDGIFATTGSGNEFTNINMDIDPDEQRDCVRAANDLYLAQARQADIDAGKRPMADWWYNPHDFQYNSYFEASEEPMGFQVGDVVRFRQAKAPGTVVGVTSQVDVFVGGITYYGIPKEDLSLVSRPSEAKPRFKAGDRVLADGKPGTIEGPHDSQGRWVRMDNDTQPGNVYWLDDSIKPMPVPPALKVGDRVRVLDSQCGIRDTGEISYMVAGTAEVTLFKSGRHRSPLCWKGSIDKLELLPPEPAPKFDAIPPELAEYGRQEVEAWRREMMGTRPDPKPPKPMTATQASIGHESMRDVYADLDADVARYVMRSLWAKPTDFNPLPKAANPDGWMPAGTYMPLEAVEPIKLPPPSRAKMLPQKGRAVAGIDYPSRDGRGSTLKQSIPERSRPLRSQTAQWGPYDILDTLEDAP